ncbi:MAG TPA: LPS export ABC transporter permease LptF [Rhodanobacteraceae bacterium]
MLRLSILDRYLLREFLLGTLAAVVVLLLIFTGSTFADVINKVATGRVSGGVMFTVLGMHLVSTLQTTLPVGMFFGILLGLGRLYRDSEMEVLAASGFGPKGLLVPTAILGVGITIMTALVSLWLGPLAVRTSHRDVEQANRSVIAAGLEPGRFADLRGRAATLFASTVSPDGTQLGKLFIESEHTDKDGVTHISVTTAERGGLVDGRRGGTRFMALYDGHRYDIPLGRGTWRSMRFQRSDAALPKPADAAGTDDPENEDTTAALVGDHAPAARAELQWRIGVPIDALVLAMLALPMARQRPRSWPAGRILVAVFAYLIVMNSMVLTRFLIADGKLVAPIGMWCVLLPPFVGAAWVFARQYAVRSRDTGNAA